MRRCECEIGLNTDLPSSITPASRFDPEERRDFSSDTAGSATAGAAAVSLFFLLPLPNQLARLGELASP